MKLVKIITIFTFLSSCHTPNDSPIEASVEDETKPVFTTTVKIDVETGKPLPNYPNQKALSDEANLSTVKVLIFITLRH